jgi:hypothetical protein
LKSALFVAIGTIDGIWFWIGFPDGGLILKLLNENCGIDCWIVGVVYFGNGDTPKIPQSASLNINYAFLSVFW